MTALQPVPAVRAGNRRRDLALLGLILISGVAVRIAAGLTFWQPGAIGGEGAEYARIAENLQSGLGYVGIGTPGPELMFPPLFPLLIALGSIVTHDYQRSGLLIAMIFGAALPLPVYGIASRLFGWQAAVIAALLVAWHPIFVGLSLSVLSEGPYITLILSAVYLVLRGLGGPPSIKTWFLAGVMFGLAFLARQEAVAPLLIAALFAMFGIRGAPALEWKCAGAALIAFFVLALPEPVFLYQTTGKLRLEDKSAVNLELGARILAGEDPRQAGYAIDGKLQGTGVWMAPNLTIVREQRIGAKILARFLVRAVHQNSLTLLHNVSASWFGAPILPAVACLGFFRRRWRRSSVARHLYVLLVMAAAIATTFSVIHAIYPRNYFVLIPFFCIWASNGVIAAGRWTRATLSGLRLERLRPVALGIAALAMAGVAAAGYLQTATAVRDDSGLTDGFQNSRALKKAGLWIRGQQSGRVKIMDLGTPPAFHADADYVHFPYTDGATAIRFLDATKVDYVILRRGQTFTDYYADWLANGIPDPRATLIHTSREGPETIMVYRWRRNWTRRLPRGLCVGQTFTDYYGDWLANGIPVLRATLVHTSREGALKP